MNVLRPLRFDRLNPIVIPELLRRCATMSGIQENRSAALKRSLDPGQMLRIFRDDGSFLRHFDDCFFFMSFRRLRVSGGGEIS